MLRQRLSRLEDKLHGFQHWEVNQITKLDFSENKNRSMKMKFKSCSRRVDTKLKSFDFHVIIFTHDCFLQPSSSEKVGFSLATNS